MTIYGPWGELWLGVEGLVADVCDDNGEIITHPTLVSSTIEAALADGTIDRMAVEIPGWTLSDAASEAIDIAAGKKVRGPDDESLRPIRAA